MPSAASCAIITAAQDRSSGTPSHPLVLHDAAGAFHDTCNSQRELDDFFSLLPD